MSNRGGAEGFDASESAEICDSEREGGKEEREARLFSALPFELVVPFVGDRYRAWPLVDVDAMANGETLCSQFSALEVTWIVSAPGRSILKVREGH